MPKSQDDELGSFPLNDRRRCELDGALAVAYSRKWQ